MVLREIITIDEDLCTGCGDCVPACPEGAIQIIDGKARLVSDLLCDGLGACIGHCPEDAITVEKREAEPYDEKKVMESIVKQGENTIRAHLQHLKDHNQQEFFDQAILFLKDNEIDIPDLKEPGDVPCGCPGSQIMDFEDTKEKQLPKGSMPSQLRQWPVQLHLVSPRAPYFSGQDVLLAADCVAYSLGDFHKHLKSKSLAIACPKLDSNQEVYVNKLRALIDNAKINTLTVMIMQVPCCSGLLTLAKKAAENAERKIPIKKIVVGIKGNIINESWM